MAKYEHCKIEFDDPAIFPEKIENGMVLINGPRATIWTWDDEIKRYDQVDRLEGVAKKGDGTEFVLSGRSQTLRENTDLKLKPAETQTAVHVVAPRGCRSC